jgi:hypothetical protein
MWQLLYEHLTPGWVTWVVLCPACTACNSDRIGDDHLFHKSNKQTKSLMSRYKNEWRIMKPIGCLLLAPFAERKPIPQDWNVWNQQGIWCHNNPSELVTSSLLRDIHHQNPLHSTSWEMWIWEPASPGWGSLRRDSKIWVWVLRDSHQWAIALQTTDRPLVREGALHDETRTFQTKEHLKSGHGPQRGSHHEEELVYWPSVAKSTSASSTSTSWVVQWLKLALSEGLNRVGATLPWS